jgi:hypothetical protein
MEAGWDTSPGSKVETPGNNSDWDQASPAQGTKATDEDDWNSPAPAPMRASAPPPPTTARTGPAIHPDRLKMMGGQGAASYSSPKSSAPIREAPPHMRSSNGSNGYGNGNGQASRAVVSQPIFDPVSD